ncbi:MAG: hypothetical protein DRR16_21855 [Candidatus Parabeggiatoa sp. nov. 3]|nr:MAG: hypothetical protein DRR16_21855 [Gammaproteobacteria bacterium]
MISVQDFLEFKIYLDFRSKLILLPDFQTQLILLPAFQTKLILLPDFQTKFILLLFVFDLLIIDN